MEDGGTEESLEDSLGVRRMDRISRPEGQHMLDVWEKKSEARRVSSSSFYVFEQKAQQEHVNHWSSTARPRLHMSVK